MSDKDSAMKIMNDGRCPPSISIFCSLVTQSSARESCPGNARDKLEWDDSLASEAEKWAKRCAEIGKMEHSSTEGQGENLFAASPKATFEAAAQAWVDEKFKYDGQPIDENFAQYSHYTQVRGFYRLFTSGSILMEEVCLAVHDESWNGFCKKQRWLGICVCSLYAPWEFHGAVCALKGVKPPLRRHAKTLQAVYS